LLFSDHILLL